MADYDEYRFDTIIEDKKRSFFRKYQDMIVGNRRIGSLLYFEFCTLLINPLQGALGLALRKFLFPHLFRRAGKNAVFGHHISMRSPGNIEVGRSTVVDDFVTLSFRGTEENAIILGDNVLVGRFSMLKTRGGTIEIENHVHIGPNCHLGTAGRMVVGEYTLIGSNCFIGGLQHGHGDTDKPMVQQALESRGGVNIGRDVWLGAGVTVMDGVTIGEGSIVGAGSIVTRDIPPYSIAVGAPARVTRHRDSSQAGD